MNLAGRWVADPEEQLTPFGMDVESVFHEFAHFAVAAPRRRGMPFYGLGHPATGRPKMVSSGWSAAEEEMASALGIHLLWKCGLRNLARETFSEHNWDVPSESERWKFLCTLRAALKVSYQRRHVDVKHERRVLAVERAMRRLR